MTAIQSKKQVRQEQKARLKSFLEEQPERKEAEEKALYEKFFSSPDWRSAQTIALTMAMPFEVATRPIMEAALKAGKTVLTARVEAGKQLSFVRIDEQTTFQPVGSFGLLEPVEGPVFDLSQIDLMLVPGLAFDQQTGQRLGFGGGYYDRVLADYPGATASLALSVQQRAGWLVDDFDQAVQTIISN
ncbi:5-formyltetrahydrofolate cyclo-ligase [Fructobacillus papyrifericola]|uniref:5-formyltetrahydrofolate cyclo-ligase n=1 Tax=Fructobacillus papyrifericola TaxID=2713172 RepID=A0ABS5QS00_9LACO|nr:5-formyltetrahydrofolate cyclo-ligase [Fructobacillus papyrifericola]MBS9335978.1 5-formyltetrahydrofolate cyclo-ligase [Fructobacillus papyrifericola]